MDYSVHPTTPLGVRLSAIKFLQRVILVHSKGVSDPRVRHFHSCLNQISHLHYSYKIPTTHTYYLSQLIIPSSTLPPWRLKATR